MDLGTDLLVAGELRRGRGKDREVENPATGEVLATVADADESDLDVALSAAAKAILADAARLVVGGERLNGAEYGDGHWISPAVLTDVRDDMTVMRDELFGPVTQITAFGSWDEVVTRANASRYGLSAYVYTSSLAVGMRASRDLAFGEVYINRAGPEEINGFHAGFRESGLGGDDGAHGLDGYFRKQTVYLRY